MTVFRRREAGQTIVLIAAVLAVMLLAVGLAVDAGQLYVNRRAAQIAADSAAWAGAVVLYPLPAVSGAAITAAGSAATADAGKNGFTNGVNGATITVNSPPASGPAAGDQYFVEVLITQSTTPTFFAGARTLSVRAVAGVTRSGTGDGVLVLSGTNCSPPSSCPSGTLDMSNTSSLSVTGSGVQVNSGSATAITIAKLPGINSPPSSYNRVKGDATGAGVKGRITPALATGQPTVSDPFVNLPGPPISGLIAAQDQNCGSVTTVSVSPGTYTGGIRMQGKCALSMIPGIYILKGGVSSNLGFQILNNATVSINGTGGVLIFNTYSTYGVSPPGGSPICGTVSLTTTKTITLRAQTAGSYAGMVIYQDRNCTGQMDFTPTGTWDISGTIYLPSAPFNFSGGVAQSMSAQLVVQTFTASGNSSALNLTFDPSKVAGGRVPALIE